MDELRAARKKELEETATLENVVQMVEENLRQTTVVLFVVFISYIVCCFKLLAFGSSRGLVLSISCLIYRKNSQKPQQSISLTKLT